MSNITRIKNTKLMTSCIIVTKSKRHCISDEISAIRHKYLHIMNGQLNYIQEDLQHQKDSLTNYECS